MKNCLLKFALLLIILNVGLNSFGQCAFEVEGAYGGRSCSQPDAASSYSQVTITAVDSSTIIISNFANLLNEDICNVEDTVIVNLDCSAMTLECESVNYDLCVVSGDLTYSGNGSLFPDSLIIPYTQWNPDSSQEVCRVYKRDAFVGISENRNILNVVVFPNPTDNWVVVKGFDLPSESLARIINVYGQLIATVRVFQNSIDLEKLPGGLYFIEMEDVQGKKLIGRVLKSS